MSNKIQGMMTKKNFPNLKLGVLGGGQLGKMLGIPANRWNLPIHFLDQFTSFPASFSGPITKGNFKNYDDVLAFGRKMDLLTIEIEHVNVKALQQLESEGIPVHPSPRALEIIQDKGLQKQFYKREGLPTAPFQYYPNKAAIEEALAQGQLTYPFVQKSRKAGYDGQGVAVINQPQDLKLILDTPSMVEEKVLFKKELAVMVARNAQGEVKTYHPVEMVFNPVANLVEYLKCPAQISSTIAN